MSIRAFLVAAIALTASMALFLAYFLATASR